MKRLLLVFLFSAPFQAHAIPITAGGATYEISAIEGTFDDLALTLTAQTWWGNESLAIALAANSAGLGNPNPITATLTLGSLFAYRLPQTADFRASALLYGLGPDPFTVIFQESRTVRRAFAIASPVAETSARTVPEPGTLALFGTGLLALAFTGRRRAKSSA